MRFTWIVIFMLLISISGAVYHLPDTEMKNGANLTFSGGKIFNSTNGSSQTDLMTIWQGWDKINKTDSIDPNRIDLSKNWNGQMHNVTNGTAAQDGVTYSQTIHAGSNSSLGGYAITSQLAPQNTVRVFRFAVPWIGTNVAVAQRGDGLPISISSNNTTAIQAAINSGAAQVRLYNLFTNTGCVYLNRNVDLVGCGWGTGIKGATSPLLKSDIYASHIVTVSDMSIETTSSNEGLNVTKTWIASSNPSVFLRNVNFTASGNAGKLFSLYGCTGGNAIGCKFESSNEASNMAYGAYVWGNSTGGAMNFDFDQCTFYDLQYAIAAIGNYNYGYLAGIGMKNCKSLACKFGFYGVGVDAPNIKNNMIDQVRFGVYLLDCQNGDVAGNYIGVASGYPAGQYGHCISFDAQHVNSWMNAATENTLVQYNSTVPANGVSCVGASVTIWADRPQIHGNRIRNCLYGVYLGAYTLVANVRDNMIDGAKTSGIKVDTGASNNVLSGNEIDESTAIQDSGTATTRDNNYDDGSNIS